MTTKKEEKILICNNGYCPFNVTEACRVMNKCLMNKAPMAELADATDLKSVSSNRVSVRF
jgi:hypothetical protein